MRGGAPGHRETDALAPENLVDAAMLSGGSVYGLGAADDWGRAKTAADTLARAVARALYETTSWPGSDIICWRGLA